MEQPTAQADGHPTEQLLAPSAIAPEHHTDNVSLTEAARLTGASRNRLYRAIEAGKISRNADGSIPVQSLLDAGFELKSERQSAIASSDTLSYLLTEYTDVQRQLAESLREQNDTLWEQCRMLQEQLRASQQREAKLWQIIQDSQSGATVAEQQISVVPDNPAAAVANTHTIPLDDGPVADEPPDESSAALSLEPEGQGQRMFSLFGRPKS